MRGIALIRFESEDGARVEVSLDDLDSQVFDRIASYEGTSAWDVFTDPARTPERAYAVLDAATDFLEIDRVERSNDPQVHAQLKAMFDAELPD
jgi:hypothetical protein